MDRLVDFSNTLIDRIALDVFGIRLTEEQIKHIVVLSKSMDGHDGYEGIEFGDLLDNIQEVLYYSED